MNYRERAEALFNRFIKNGSDWFYWGFDREMKDEYERGYKEGLKDSTDYQKGYEKGRADAFNEYYNDEMTRYK